LKFKNILKKYLKYQHSIFSVLSRWPHKKT